MSGVIEIREHAAAVAEAIYEDGYGDGGEAGFIEGYNAGYSAGARVALDTAALTVDQVENEVPAPGDVSLETLVATLNKWAPNVDAFQQALAEAVEELEGALEKVSDFSDADALLVENLAAKVEELTERIEFLEEDAGVKFIVKGDTIERI